MSSYLFDTCIVRKWFAKRPKIMARVQGLSVADNLYVSAITLGEIEFGHSSVAAIDPAKQAAFRKWMRESFEIPQLAVTEATAQEYAKFRRRLFDKFTRKGKYPEVFEDHLGKQLGIDENDLWLVATAAEHHLNFVTNDKMERINDIVRTDAKIVRWLDD